MSIFKIFAELNKNSCLLDFNTKSTEMTGTTNSNVIHVTPKDDDIILTTKNFDIETSALPTELYTHYMNRIINAIIVGKCDVELFSKPILSLHKSRKIKPVGDDFPYIIQYIIDHAKLLISKKTLLLLLRLGHSRRTICLALIISIRFQLFEVKEFIVDYICSDRKLKDSLSMNINRTYCYLDDYVKNNSKYSNILGDGINVGVMFIYFSEINLDSGILKHNVSPLMQRYIVRAKTIQEILVATFSHTNLNNMLSVLGFYEHIESSFPCEEVVKIARRLLRVLNNSLPLHRFLNDLKCSQPTENSFCNMLRKYILAPENILKLLSLNSPNLLDFVANVMDSLQLSDQCQFLKHIFLFMRNKNFPRRLSMNFMYKLRLRCPQKFSVLISTVDAFDLPKIKIIVNQMKFIFCDRVFEIIDYADKLDQKYENREMILDDGFARFYRSARVLNFMQSNDIKFDQIGDLFKVFKSASNKIDCDWNVDVTHQNDVLLEFYESFRELINFGEVVRFNEYLEYKHYGKTDVKLVDLSQIASIFKILRNENNKIDIIREFFTILKLNSCRIKLVHDVLSKLPKYDYHTAIENFEVHEIVIHNKFLTQKYSTCDQGVQMQLAAVKIVRLFKEDNKVDKIREFLNIFNRTDKRLETIFYILNNYIQKKPINFNDLCRIFRVMKFVNHSNHFDYMFSGKIIPFDEEMVSDACKIYDILANESNRDDAFFNLLNIMKTNSRRIKLILITLTHYHNTKDKMLQNSCESLEIKEIIRYNRFNNVEHLNENNFDNKKDYKIVEAILKYLVPRSNNVDRIDKVLSLLTLVKHRKDRLNLILQALTKLGDFEKVRKHFLENSDL